MQARREALLARHSFNSLTETGGLVFFLHVSKAELNSRRGGRALEAVAADPLRKFLLNLPKRGAAFFVPRDRRRASGLVMPPSPTQEAVEGWGGGKSAVSAGSEVRLLEEEKLPHLGKLFRPRWAGDFGVTRLGCRRTEGRRKIDLRPRYLLW